MTKGERNEYAIEKAVSEYSFIELLEEWGVKEEDWEKFTTAIKIESIDIAIEALSEGALTM